MAAGGASIWRRLERGVLLAALAVAVFCVLGEILARSFDLVDRLNGFPRRLFVATDDPDLAYRLRPGVDTVARGVHVSINEHGMRGPSFSREPAPGTHRVLALGDSVTFGFRLELGDTFPVLLEEALERRSGERWEVLNAGVEGYNTRNQLAWLRESLLGLEPGTVVLVFNLNDYDHGPVMGPLGVLTLEQSERVPTTSLANLSEFYLLLRWLVATQVAAETRPGEFDPLDRYVSSLRKQYYHEPNDARWQVMVDSLREIAALCRARGIRLVVAIVPDGDQVGVAAPDLTPQRRLRDVCASLELDCLDLHPSFAAAAEPALYLDIMHPNAAGQRIMARAVAEHMLGGRS